MSSLVWMVDLIEEPRWNRGELRGHPRMASRSTTMNRSSWTCSKTERHLATWGPCAPRILCVLLRSREKMAQTTTTTPD